MIEIFWVTTKKLNRWINGHYLIKLLIFHATFKKIWLPIFSRNSWQLKFFSYQV